MTFEHLNLCSIVSLVGIAIAGWTHKENLFQMRIVKINGHVAIQQTLCSVYPCLMIFGAVDGIVIATGIKSLENGTETLITGIPVHGVSLPQNIQMVDSLPYCFKLLEIGSAAASVGRFNY